MLQIAQKTDTGDFPGAKLHQVGGGNLTIDQLEAGLVQSLHQMDKRHFRGVADPGEHGFTEEAAPQGYPIETASQFFPVPGFDRMGQPGRMQSFVSRDHFRDNPGARMIRTSFSGTPVNDPSKSLVQCNGKGFSTQQAFQRMGNVQFFRIKDQTGIRRPPENRVVFSIPWKDALAIRQHETFDAQIAANRKKAFINCQVRRREGEIAGKSENGHKMAAPDMVLGPNKRGLRAMPPFALLNFIALFDLKRQIIAIMVHKNNPALGQFAKKDFVCQVVFDLFLYDAP